MGTLEMIPLLELWVLVLILLNQILVISSQNVTCHSNDLRALTSFIEGLNSPLDTFWPINSSSLNCCSWVGITCDLSSGRVVKLELANKRLTGNLSDSISNFDQLSTLNLSHNYLRGPLPVSLFHLSFLESVDLSNNKFFSVLPVSINLPKLKVLDISDNSLTGFLPYELCVNSTKIRVLNFGLNYFNGTIPPHFVNCRFIENLSVASNFLTGSIPDFLLTLPKLRELALHDNEFMDINGIVNSSSQLFRLDISSNWLSGNIPDFFDSFPNLSYFSAHSNNLSGGIPPSLSNSQSISSLDLRNNSLDGSINLNCSMMRNLTSLNLGSNNFSGAIPANLASCNKLKALNLARNKLVGEVPESFKNFESLSFLSLSNCSITNLLTALKILQHCPNLTVLVLTMNFYREQFPYDDDLQFKSLKALVIPDCRLTGNIPSWLTSLTQLQLLDLSHNRLTGSIPAYMGDFRSLFYLDLSNNSLSGNIPKKLTQLQSLISREILFEEPSPDFPFFKKNNQYNQIIRFPPQLDLSSNLLTGPIWPEFGNLKKLHVLGLQHNNLSGTIPSSLSDLISIETMDLSYNLLTGTIPPSLAKLSFLSKFSVAYNNLTGIIPSGGQFLTFLNTSFEGNPGLCGNLVLRCQNNQDLLQPHAPEDAPEDDELSILRILVITGFGSGFLGTVISLLVVPRFVESHR